MRTEFIALPDMPETSAELTARARALIAPARICAEDGGHRLGRWTRGQTGRQTVRLYVAPCKLCGQQAYVTASRGVNEYGGGAALLRCAAQPENRCELGGVEPYVTGPDGVAVPCDRPYVTRWTYQDGPGTIRACDEHSRTYRRIAGAVPGFGWRQTGGPTDY